MGHATFITGAPGVGKTTVIKAIVAAVGAERCGGFYTEEIRDGDRRTGFRIVTLSGETAVLAHVDVSGTLRVGKYGVQLKDFENIAVPALYRAVSESELIIIDEIGPMELFSERFKEAVNHVLASGKPLLGTIVQRNHPWSDRLKKEKKMEFITLTPENRDGVKERLKTLFKGLSCCISTDSGGT